MIPLVAVIVPTVLGLGILVSVVVLLRDAWFRLRGPGWMSRRCGIQGQAAARAAVDPAGGPLPTDPAHRAASGLRSPLWYAETGILFVFAAFYLWIGSWGNYAGWRSWLESIAWIWLVFLVAGAGFAVVGVAALVLAFHRGAPPAWVRLFLARTPLGRPPDRPSVATTVVAHPRHVRRTATPSAVRPLGRGQITDTVAVAARAVAGVWTIVAVSVVGWLTINGRMPATPEELDAGIAGPAWIVLYVLLVVAAVAVYRWELAGAIALAVSAAALGLMSSLQYPPWVAVLLAAVFAVPAFLHWLAWQRDHHIHHLVRVAVFTSVLVAGVWIGAGRVYAYYFGPTHPDSSAAVLSSSPVEWVWVGGTTSRSATVVVGVGERRELVRVGVSTSAGLDDIVWSEPADVGGGDDTQVARLPVTGLAPGTRYHWAVEVDGEVDRMRTGSFRTMPEGPSSFTLAVGACARSGSNGAVFDALREADPLVYLQVGDLHYANIGVDDPGRFRAALEQVLTAPGQSALYRSTSIAYVWDDHDYASNDGDATSPSRPAAEEVYRSWVPFHPLVSDSDDGPIGQAFVAGRVRVVMTDTRSQRTPPGAEEGAGQQMFGPEQERWFAAQLAAARDAGQVVLWAGSTPWIGEAVTAGDTWAGYADARRRTADLIVAAGMEDRLVMVAGDAHMVAIDDGTHTDYSTEQVGGFPLLQAAALDRPGSVKGGPYSSGTFPGGGQYGEVEVTDDGGPGVDISLRGLTWDGRILAEETFTLPTG